MSESFFLYDNTEHTTTRFVGFLGAHGRYDVAFTTTSQFYGKKLVCAIQTGRNAVLDESDAANIPYIMRTFALSNEDEGTEFSEFLLANL